MDERKRVSSARERTAVAQGVPDLLDRPAVTEGVRSWAAPSGTPRRFRLATLLLTLVLSVLLPTLGLGIGVIWYAVSGERDAADARLQDGARDIAVALDRQLTGYLQAIVAYTTSPAFGPDPTAADVPALYAHAKIMADKLGVVVGVIRPDGTRLFNTTRRLGTVLPPVSGLRLVQGVAETGRPAVANLVLGSVSGQYSVSIGAPVFDRNNHVALVAMLVVRAEALRRLLLSAAMPAGGFSSILDGNGVVVARSDELHFEAVGRAAVLSGWATPQGRAGGVFTMEDHGGKRDRYAFQLLQAAPGWQVYVAQPASVRDRAWQRPLLLFGLIGVLTVALSSALALLAARPVLRPLLQLADYARSVASAAAGASLTEAPAPSSVREVEALRQVLVAAELSLRQQAQAEREAATERAARAAELRALFEASPIGLGRVRAGGDIIEANDVLLSILGRTRVDLDSGRLRWTDLTAPVDGPAVTDKAAAWPMAPGEPRCVPYERVFLRPDGTRVPVLVNFTKLRPNVLEAALFVVDLTQTRQAEHQLRDLLATVDMGAFMTRDLDGTIRHWSAGIEKLYGWPAAEAVGRNAHFLLRTVFPVSRQAVEAKLARTGRWSGDLTHRARDGRPVIVTAQKLLRRNAQGQDIVCELLTDVTAQREAEAALAESEARLRAIGDASPDPIYSKDRAGRTLYANPATIRVFGDSADDGVQLAPQGGHDDETMRRRRENDRIVMESGEAATFEEMVTGRDGTSRLFLSTKAPLRDPATGAVTGIAGISRDITDQRAYAAVAARLGSIVTSTPDAVISFAAADGRIQSWNGGAEALFGWTEAEATGGPVNLLVPDWLPDHDPTGVFAFVMQGQVVRDHETVRRTKAGLEIPVAVTAARMMAPDGSVIGVCAIFRDLRPRNAVQAELRDSEARWRNLAESYPGFVFVADAGGKNVYTNSQMQAFGGVTAEALLGDGWLDMLHPEDRDRAAATWAEAVRTGDSYQAEYRFRSADGQYHWYLCRGVPQRDADGRIVRWNGASIDITEIVAARDLAARNAAELERLVEARTRELERTQERLALAAKMEALGRLAGGIAHDFNNVLQAVQGGVALAMRRLHSQPDKVATYLNIASEAAERGVAVTGRLLTFARRGELSAEPIAAEPMLDGLAQLLRHTLGPSVTVVVDAPADLPHLLADKAQLETVLVNLANNSRDAMLNAVGTIRLVAEAVDRAPAPLTSSRYVRLAIVDDGSGMTPDILARVSEPFFTTKPRGAGTGLGLAMARGFAEQSGGALSVESAPGVGTTVSVWLPVAAEPEAAATDPADTVLAMRPRRRVMVVDDEPMVRMVIASVLADQGHEVTEVGSAAAALALLETGLAIEVLVTDLAMPGTLDGLGLIRAARQRQPGLPTALLTGHTGDAGRTELADMAQSGPFVVLHKPVSARVLAAKIAGLLDG